MLHRTLDLVGSCEHGNVPSCPINISQFVTVSISRRTPWNLLYYHPCCKSHQAVRIDNLSQRILFLRPISQHSLCVQFNTISYTEEPYLLGYNAMQSCGSACCLFQAGFFLGLPFNPEDWGDMFLWNVSWLQWTTQCCIPEDGTLHNYHCKNFKFCTSYIDSWFDFSLDYNLPLGI
jgi:hypothetical protein